MVYSLRIKRPHAVRLPELIKENASLKHQRSRWGKDRPREESFF
jgi:hypothetical protein